VLRAAAAAAAAAIITLLLLLQRTLDESEDQLGILVIYAGGFRARTVKVHGESGKNGFSKTSRVHKGRYPKIGAFHALEGVWLPTAPTSKPNRRPSNHV